MRMASVPVSAATVSSVRQRLIDLPSLTQVIAAKQCGRLEVERAEFERRTEIEADVFEWRWAVSAFGNLLQSAFHSFTMQLVRASDHADEVEREVAQLGLEFDANAAAAERVSAGQRDLIAKLAVAQEEAEARIALVNLQSFQWVDAARMLARELGSHARLLTTYNKRFAGANAGLSQQQRDVFLFQRRQLQEFELDNRHSLMHAAAQSQTFFGALFAFARAAAFSYEKKIRTVGRRLELVMATERDVTDVNVAILSRKAQLLAQTGAASAPVHDAQAHALSLRSPGMANVRDANLRAFPEFKRPDLARSPLEIVQRDELVQRRLLHDLFLDWITTVMFTVQRRMQ